MLYVSHRLEEVFAISDCVTITRNGRDVLTKDRADLTIPEVIEGMIGVQHEALFPPPLPPAAGRADEQIVVKGLSGGPLRDVDLTARAGEVVGLAGLEGSGVSALLSILFGTQRATRRRGRLSRRARPAAEPDRRGAARRLPGAGRPAAERADARKEHPLQHQPGRRRCAEGRLVAVPDRPGLCPRASVRSTTSASRRARPGRLANQLSGGNQQKVVIGKWLEIGPKVFLLDDPTRGVDVGAKREIYGLIRKMSADGGIVLFSSTELPELIGLCDRIVVFYQGRHRRRALGAGVDDRTLLHLINTGEMPAARRQRTRGHAMTDTGSATSDARCSSPARGFRLPEEIGVIVALVLMIVIIGIARPRFLNPINLLTILGHTTFQGMLAIGMVYLLAIREIDLSVGWIFNFSAVFSGAPDGRRRRSVDRGASPASPSAPASACSTASSPSASGCRRSSSPSAPIRCSRACRWW